MATPSYSYPVMGSGGAALQGVMSGLTGGLMEIEEAKRAKEQMTKFSTILADRGYTADAAIYRTMADAQRPNFFQAAITGKTTKRDTDGMAEHALAILQKERDNDVRLATQRDQGLALDVSLVKSQLSENKSKLSYLRKEKDQAVDVINDPESSEYQVAAAEKKVKTLDADMAQIEADSAAAYEAVRKATQSRGRAETSRDFVTPNVDVPELPTQAPYSSPDGSDASNPLLNQESPVPEGKPVAKPFTVADAFAGASSAPLSSSIGTAAPKSVTEESPAVKGARARSQNRENAIRATKDVPEGFEFNTEKDFELAATFPSKISPDGGVFKSWGDAKAFAAGVDKDSQVTLRGQKDGRVLATVSPKSDKPSDTASVAYKHSGTGDIWYLDGSKVYRTKNGGTTEVVEYEDRFVAARKLEEVIKTAQKFNGEDAFQLLPANWKLTYSKQAANTPIAPSPQSPYSPPSNNAAQSYAPNVEAWKNSLKKPSG